MKQPARLFLAALPLAAAALACILPTGGAPAVPTIDLATMVAATLQAMTPDSTDPAEAPAPLPADLTPTPGLLPRSLHYLRPDNSGITQVFRLETDGHTEWQITREPLNVESYDVSPVDGSVAYVAGNQLLWINADGSGRRLLVDGGALGDDLANFTQRLTDPRWSRDGSTIALGYNGLNFYSLASGTLTNVLTNKVDMGAGFPILQESYWPEAYSPDGSKLLIHIGFYEGSTFAVHFPASGALVRFSRPESDLICCAAAWAPDSSAVFVASPYIGMIDSGLWRFSAADGGSATLLPSQNPDGTLNFVDGPVIGPDGWLYYFYNNLREIPSGHTPLTMARSAVDGVSGRVTLRPETFEAINEILWAPDASFALVAQAPTQDVYQGGQIVLYPIEARPPVMLVSYASDLRWGP